MGIYTGSVCPINAPRRPPHALGLLHRTVLAKKMKSFVMGIYFLGVSLGNLFTSAVNFFIQNEDGSVKLEGAQYYWFFTTLMAIAAVVFVFVAMRYKGRRHVQGED